MHFHDHVQLTSNAQMAYVYIHMLLHTLHHHTLQVHSKKAHLTVHQFQTWFNVFLQNRILRSLATFLGMFLKGQHCAICKILVSSLRCTVKASNTLMVMSEKMLFFYHKIYLNKLNALEATQTSTNLHRRNPLLECW